MRRTGMRALNRTWTMAGHCECSCGSHRFPFTVPSPGNSRHFQCCRQSLTAAGTGVTESDCLEGHAKGTVAWLRSCKACLSPFVPLHTACRFSVNHCSGDNSVQLYTPRVETVKRCSPNMVENFIRGTKMALYLFCIDSCHACCSDMRYTVVSSCFLFGGDRERHDYQTFNQKGCLRARPAAWRLQAWG